MIVSREMGGMMTEALMEKKACFVDPAQRESDSKPERERKVGKRNKALGARGEEAAARFLDRRGYEILERNWTCFAGEADIIARDEDTIVFVEVKTRKDCGHGFPSEAVTAAKREKYEKIALAFLSDYEPTDFPVRFDVVSIVVIGPDKAMIRHQINAFSLD
jgi:putative endonuclease